MKKLFTLIIAVMATYTLVGQVVQRSKVVVEIATGTWCVWCPGAANGADDLVANGKQVAIIENHNGDAYANSYSNARNSYYAITGYPTAVFDGTSRYVGGAQCPSGTNYANYLPLYNAKYAIQSPLTIDISGTNSGDNYNIVLSIHKCAAISGTDLRVHLFVTETNINCPAWPPSGQCLTQVHFVNRMMVPGTAGTQINFSSGDMKIVNLSFTKNSSWVTNNCSLICFVQDYTTKTIYNGVLMALGSLPPPVQVDFAGTPVTGCSPMTTNFTDQSVGVNAWQWSCPGGTPSSPTIQNPSVTYDSGGVYDVTLVAWDTVLWRGNIKVKTGYVNVTTGSTIYSVTGGGAYCAQGGTGLPVGLNGSQTGINYTLYLDGSATTNVVPGTGSAITFGNQMTAGTYTVMGTNPVTTCSNSMDGNAVVSVDPQVPNVPGDPSGPTTVHTATTPTTDYTTTGGTYATTYTWSLTPSDAGTISGNTATGTANWNNTFIGTAHIKVQGVNTCGGGTFSNEITITVDNATGIAELSGKKLVNIYPNPAKGSLYIVAAKSMKADIKIINALGSVVVDKKAVQLSGTFQVDISSLNAGVYFINITGNEGQQIQKIVVE